MPQTTHPRTQPVGLIGQLDDATFWKDAWSKVNSMTAATDGSDVIYFGTACALETDGTIKRLDAQADVLAGILIRGDAYNLPNELAAGNDTAGSPGIKAQAVGSVLKRGRIRVMLDETVAAGDTVRYYAKAVSGKRQGAFRTTDPTGTDTVVISTGARFVEGGTVATGAVLEFDLLAMTFSADV